MIPERVTTDAPGSFWGLANALYGYQSTSISYFILYLYFIP